MQTNTLKCIVHCSSNIKKAAYDESKVIIEDAKRNATKVINNALQKAERIESEMEYPGQIKVNVIRETRAVDYAK